MGIFERIARLRSSAGLQEFEGGLKQAARPRLVGELTAVQPRADGSWDLEATVYTGEESPWQAPMTDSLRSRPPAGVEPRVGQRVVIKPPRGEDDEPKVLWDEPEPDVPPMQLPRIPGGDDPNVMLEHLEGLVKSGALDQAGLERARAYLESQTGGSAEPPS
jgi:hypothetical protein